MNDTHMESRDQIIHWLKVWGTAIFGVAALIGVTALLEML